MTGSKVNDMKRKRVAAAVQAIPSDADYVWDGSDDDDRPLTKEEMRAGMVAAKSRGRPAGSKKEQVAIRFDHEVLVAFRASGPGWQTRMNDALKDWLRTHQQKPELL